MTTEMDIPAFLAAKYLSYFAMRENFCNALSEKPLAGGCDAFALSQVLHRGNLEQTWGITEISDGDAASFAGFLGQSPMRARVARSLAESVLEDKGFALCSEYGGIAHRILEAIKTEK